jgi:hypothetical protein
MGDANVGTGKLGVGVGPMTPRFPSTIELLLPTFFALNGEIQFCKYILRYLKTMVLLATMISPQTPNSPFSSFEDSPTRSRVEQLVALLSALETLDSLVVHLLSHLLVSELLLLGFATVLDALDIGLLSRSVMLSWEGEVMVNLWRPRDHPI